jgi:tight adherence protein B
VEATAAMLDRQAAEVAGPRLSGYLLAALPVLGLLLGTGMGADPVAVLVSTGLGQVLLVVGVGLSCAGLRWIARIVR